MNRLLTVLIFLSTSVCAQNAFKAGFIKHLDGQTEYGYIQLMPSNMPLLVCYFKPNQNDLVQEFQPSEIAGYGFLPDAFYYAIASKPSDAKPDLFAEIIHNGKVTVYKSGDRILISVDGKLSELFKNDYQNTISTVLAECPYVVERVKSSPFTEAEIMYLIRSYEKCVQKPDPNKFHGTELKFNALIFAGMDLSTLTFNTSSVIHELAGKGAMNSTPYRVGFQVHVAYTAFNPNFSLVLGGTYRPQSYSIAYTTSGSTAAYQFNTSYSELQIPIGLQLSLSNNKPLTFNLQGGVALSKVSNFQAHQIFDQRTSQGIYQNESTPANQITSGTGIYLGIGGVFRTASKYRFAFNLQYQTGSITLKDLEVTQSSAAASSISASFGILF